MTVDGRWEGGKNGRTQQLDEGRAGIPGVQRDCVLAFAADQIDARHGADRNEVSLGRLKARLDEERLELLANVLVAILRPINLTPTKKNVNPTRQTWERRRREKK